MLTTILDLATCLLLTGASIYWMVRRAGRSGAHRFLFPFIIVSGTAGIVLTISPLLEIWVAYYNGSMLDIVAMEFRFTGPYWWMYSALLAFPLFPLLGILPLIGRRPLLMAGIGISSVSPSLFLLWAPALISFFQ